MTDFGRVTVVGLGQTGGSIAHELTRQKRAVVTGYDCDRAVLRRARRMGLAATVTGDLTRALNHADLVILALPVASIVAALMDSSIPFDAGSLVIDVGSTKRLIMAAANRRTPPLRFVGGHPLAGNERRGLNGVEPGLFSGAAFALVPGMHARPSDLRTARRFVRALGARPLIIDADDHDRITALTIGLPHSIAFLVRELYDRAASTDRRVGELSGGSIWSTLRVSESDPTMVGDFIASNRDYIEALWAELIGPRPKGKGRKSKATGRNRRRRSRRP
jgi:prephenate dehydrogenase